MIRLYPRAWRDRYGAELSALLEVTPMSWRLRADLLLGAAREWVHELTRPRPKSAQSRVTRRVLWRLVSAATLGLVVVVVSRSVAPRLSGFELPPLAVALLFALYIGLLVRAFVVGRAAWSPAAPRRVISYLEFGSWVLVAVSTSTAFAIDSVPTRWPYTAVFSWYIAFDWLLGATPRAARHAEIERRLMRRTGIQKAAMERYERKRAANAERLIQFYSRFTIGSPGSIQSDLPAGPVVDGDRAARLRVDTLRRGRLG